LAWANLRHTNLSGADLRKADLSGLTDLSGAYVSKANLSGADLSGAYNLIYDEVVNKVTKQLIANKALEHRAKSLKGATMPNGHKYEDWLKSKDRTADRENE
jgi:uncharacterized protein YjbI with pentapeptide repeats